MCGPVGGVDPYITILFNSEIAFFGIFALIIGNVLLLLWILIGNKDDKRGD